MDAHAPLYDVRERIKDMEVEFTKKIREFEEDTGCVVTRVELKEFNGMNYINIGGVWLGRNLKEKEEE